MGYLNTYNSSVQAYYEGNDHGNYQFTSLENIITQFQIAYVGENKIIPKLKKADVSFHAMRALQELSFDTFKSVKSHQIDLPASLTMMLPHDYVNYAKISWVDSSGIKHPLYRTNDTNNPLHIAQDDSGYVFPSEIALATNGDFSNGMAGWSTNITRRGSGALNVGYEIERKTRQAAGVKMEGNKMVFDSSSKPDYGDINSGWTNTVYQEIDVSDFSTIGIEARGSSRTLKIGDKFIGSTILRLGITTNPQVVNPLQAGNLSNFPPIPLNKLHGPGDYQGIGKNPKESDNLNKGIFNLTASEYGSGQPDELVGGPSYIEWNSSDHNDGLAFNVATGASDIGTAPFDNVTIKAAYGIDVSNYDKAWIVMVHFMDLSGFQGIPGEQTVNDRTGIGRPDSIQDLYSDLVGDGNVVLYSQGLTANDANNGLLTYYYYSGTAVTTASIAGISITGGYYASSQGSSLMSPGGNSQESSTWKAYKSSGLAENNNDDYKDDTYWPANGERYGLDPQHAQANGSFYIDDRLGKIHFSSNISGKTVILDYISDGIGTDAEMQVHKFAEDAMYKYIIHAVMSTSSYGQQLVPRLTKEKFAAIRKAKLRLSSVKLEELTQVLRGKSKQIKH